MDTDIAPSNSHNEFLTLCGVLGVGKYLSRSHDDGLVMLLRERANDSRTNVRNMVVKALKMIGYHNNKRLLRYANSWAGGTYRDQRAALAAICDADFLVENDIALKVLELLDWVTVSIITNDDEKITGYDELRQLLEKCWSIAVVARPRKGKKMMERWMKEDKPVINQIMRKNMTQHRMQQLDAYWVRKWQARLYADDAQ